MNDLTVIVEKLEIEHVVNNEHDVSINPDIELVVRLNAEKEDVHFNVLYVLDQT